MSLTSTSIQNAKPKLKPYKVFDAGGLYLKVYPNGSKYWQVKYRFAGKEKTVSIGVYPEVSLKEAREKRDEARKQLRDNIDPSADKITTKRQLILNSENNFKAISLEWHDKRKHLWTEKHQAKVIRKLELDIFPALGNTPVNEITAPQLLSVIRKIESNGTIDKAHRLLQTVGQIMRYAIATGRAERDISSDLRGALKPLKKESYAHLKEDELPELLQKLEKYDGEAQTKMAVKLLLLTFVRTIELRGAKWKEIDLDKAEWRVPEERMKMRKPHIVPLSKQVVKLLEELKLINGAYEHILPNRNNPKTFISENTILYALYRMGYHSRTTAHGFRATASTILNEHGFKPDVIERQLAHQERNKVRASYNYAQYLPERKIMMQWWADYIQKGCVENSSKKVVKFSNQK
jgi:integrase